MTTNTGWALLREVHRGKDGETSKACNNKEPVPALTPRGRSRE